MPEDKTGSVDEKSFVDTINKSFDELTIAADYMFYFGIGYLKTRYSRVVLFV